MARIIFVLKRAFERNNGRFLVASANSLGEARAYLADYEPELIIADIRLPDGRRDDCLRRKTLLF